MDGPSTAEIAREVDRLVIAVHRRVMTTHRVEVEELMQPIAATGRGHLYDLAEFLAAGRGTTEVAERRYPYDRDGRAVAMIDQLGEDKLLDDDQQPTAVLARVLGRLLDLRAEVAADLWAADLRADGLDRVLPGAAEACAAATGPLVDEFRLLPQPSAPAHRLHHLLTGLRYARLEAHVAAWEEVGLTASDILALDAGATANPTVPASDRLVTRGWLAADGSATAAGLEARVAIEAGTDLRCDPMFVAVTDRPAWFEALQRLDGGPADR